MHTGSETAKWDAHAGGVSDVCFHPTGALATGGRDGRVKVWDATGKAARRPRPGGGPRAEGRV